MPALDRKAASVFAGKVVRKDLVRKVKVGANVPVFVLEYLLGKYCATLQDVFLIEKDTKRFPDTKGWAYAVFDYNPASDTYTPDATGTVNCGFACHTIVASKDYIFHSYQKR